MGEWLAAMKDSSLEEGSISTVDLKGAHIQESMIGGEV